jgi:hypothetical protein
MKIQNIKLRIKYRFKYHYWKIMHFIGLCPRCFTMVSYTQHGKAICPNQCKY